MHNHKIILFVFFISASTIVLAQKDNQAKEVEKALKESTNITYEANQGLVQNDFVQAEADYRRAISKSGENTAAPYNLGRAYYNRESFAEAFSRFKEAGEKAMEKPTKHKAFHNMGNVFMKNKEYQKAVEAYKQALRSNPNDDETRYNLALAKEMLKNDQNNNNNDQNKDDQNKDQGDEGDKGEQKPEENKKGDGEEKQEQKKQPNQGEEPEKKPLSNSFK